MILLHSLQVIVPAAIGPSILDSGKQRVIVVASLALQFSMLAFVCSGLHSDANLLSVDCELAADACKAGVMKQLTLCEFFHVLQTFILVCEDWFSEWTH